MGFSAFTTHPGLTELESHLATRSYIDGYTPSQADVAVYKALPQSPDWATYPHSARWYSHIASYEAEHTTLPGDTANDHTNYGPASSAAAPAATAATADDEEEIDLFGSDDEVVDAEAERIKQDRLAAYAAKKSAKPATIAKSIVTLEVKPWDDETDLDALEAAVRGCTQEGLVWGLSKRVPIGYGIFKTQFTLVIEDAKVGVDDLQDRIAEECDEFVQSSDVVAMAKIVRLCFL